jgi:hypothetical protein
VVDLLQPWRDESATRDLAEANPPASGILYRGGAPRPQPVSSALEETAAYVLDDLDSPPNPLDSPSQISQGTVPIAASTQDTLSGLHLPRRAPNRPQPESLTTSSSKQWPTIALTAGLIAAAAGAAAIAWLAGLF